MILEEYGSNVDKPNKKRIGPSKLKGGDTIDDVLTINLNKNRINEIDDRAFAGIPNLQILGEGNNFEILYF
ncbi:hypothetical protein Avbf_08816 [Armadillidium vulgare]|nr:hypothetical protein Avbf_08816 [Armadillidium vulgare]